LTASSPLAGASCDDSVFSSSWIADLIGALVEYQTCVVTDFFETLNRTTPSPMLCDS